MIRGLRRLIDREPAPPAPISSHFDTRASAADIEACFRLILGRHPNPEERAGHFARAGEALSTVVASYLSSLEFSRRELGRASDQAPIEVQRDGYVIMVREDDLAVGKALLLGAYEPDVCACISRHLAPGQGVIDLGANIGAISMLAAAIVGPGGYVLAVEPNPRNAHLLETSRRRNGFAQLVVCQCAAGPHTELLAFHASFSNGTTSSLPDGNSIWSDATTVASIPPERLVPADRRIDLIKADVEGAEYLALQGCLAIIRRDRPIILSEFSPDMLAGISGIDGPSYCNWLVSLGYRLSVIGPDGGLSSSLDAAGIMQAYRARGTDHIDIAARV